MLRLNLINHSKSRMPRTFLGEWVREMARYLVKHVDQGNLRGRELTIVFLEKGAARALNRKFRGRNCATDVLSFMSETPESLGELAICPDVIKRQAGEHGLTFREELGYMVLHGTLHLLGFDHETSKKEAKQMFALQDQVFEKLLK